MPFFVDTSLTLVLNKTDLFKEKIGKYPLTNCFSEYQGESNYEETSNFIRQKFESWNKRFKEINTYFAYDTDTDKRWFRLRRHIGRAHE